MATSESYIEFVCEQINGYGEIRYRKMFGEYIAYLNDKSILTVCDNTVFVKKLPEIEKLMKNADCGFPYDGAKECYILDIEDKGLLDKLIPILEGITPKSKPRKKWFDFFEKRLYNVTAMWKN